ncbi:hypothetical protein PUNSTDRAFT_103446 [Punctularia strigosozonata HHB-11173 SS5]|uniref:uncharacterized protein n=1 Tax=Punctularia strigosozonata (strain HHB-11173) TaxID=741275 RepID=UPI0004416DEC|nr:uncharacterized protein PUNSTDRAFT_103446 [Punctularia strigosozonata HHB-11173 SS5]EIN08585.1 hypothetical protein PUNSTDRAFT_103446 [Punctularia strigosozonata HHB-11173 SS5]
MAKSPLDTPIGPLLLVVFESILEVFLLCLAGYILARKGILDKKTQKQFNRVNVSIFTPSLLFSKVAFFLTPAKMKELWIVPFFFFITTGVSMVVAYVLSKLFRLKRSQRSFAMAASMFMNSNSLPIALMQSLITTVKSLKWGDDDNKSAMIGRALTYLVLHSTLGMVLRWSYGVRLLAQADPETNPQVAGPGPDQTSPLLEREELAFPPAPAEEQLHHHRHLYTDSESTQTASGSSTPYRDPHAEDQLRRAAEEAGLPRSWGTPGIKPPAILVRAPTGEGLLRPGMDRKGTGVFYSFPNSPSHMAREFAESDDTLPPFVLDSDEDHDDEFPAPGVGRREITAPATSRMHSFRRRAWRRVKGFWTAFNDFMTVPLWAALLSLIVALIQPLQHALDDHFPPVKNALSAAGNCSIPVTLIVLGAYFYNPPEPGAAEQPPVVDARKTKRSSMASIASVVGSVKGMLKMGSLRGKERRDGSPQSLLAGAKKGEKVPGETKTVFVAVVSRMVVTPLLLLPGMALSAKFDWHQVLEDPVFVVSNVLLIASPPALTLAQITQAASGDSFERLISRTVFWSYCVVTPPATIIFVVIGLLLSKL